MFNLSILEYNGLFSFWFRLSVLLDLTSKSGVSETTERLVLIIILRDSLDI